MSSRPVDPVSNLRTLIQCPSVTPAEGGALDALAAMLAPLKFEIERPVFTEAGTPDIENLYARYGRTGPHLMFAGHTDVVPVGDDAVWSHPPFSADIQDGLMFGRGAVDMKGGIACFVAALARHLEANGTLPGSISFLITGDEEGPALNGSVKLLKWAAERGERWDACILGEPTNPEALGDMIKIGRRGSLSATVVIKGVQGHVAYPHFADNPVRSAVQMATGLLSPSLDEGTPDFQPTNLEITSIDTGNSAVNVIPGKTTLSFNVRFNDLWTPDSLKRELERRLERAAAMRTLHSGERKGSALYEVLWKEQPSQAFLTHDETLIRIVKEAVAAVTGRSPALSTSGGTSDARFIKDYCPVVEFGLVGKTMHMVDENVAIEDLETLTEIYGQMIRNWFASK
ncbi:succinyl-diaminopimelate desuccinylase [Oricola cellulosilytica]|uniref:Succinyl-diaminopimelate desuccinylase n=1 Tax=Oricola cellulosilytica TaxID=1429082 RepID=A0A4R0PM70_9HYPH|nr:succinyl-diaminopimelate desuccinylase [Oricola cellulosilytica]TCD16469.1 succinyl-diaminopimelate desuccinylase [Oricola cellulosilytica]